MNKKYLLARIGTRTNLVKRVRQMQQLLYLSLILNIIFIFVVFFMAMRVVK